MRLTVAAVLACLPALAFATGLAGADTPPPRDELRGFVCQRALDPPARAISVQAVMRPVTGTAKMQMRFDLMRRVRSDGPFRLVRGRFLGSWISPDDPTLGQRPGDVWIVNHPVVNLAAPATYRFRVSFRWFDANSHQLASDVQTSPNCYQPEQRADLLVRSLSVRPLPTGGDAYTALLDNRGHTASGQFQVQFAGVGSVPQLATVASLGPRSETQETFVAAACTSGSTLTVTVDPQHTVDEYDFANNVLTMPCPAPSASASAAGP